MTSRHVIMGRATSAGCSVTRFVSRSRQPPFASANDGTDPVRFNCITDKCNQGRKPWQRYGCRKVTGTSRDTCIALSS